MALEILYTPYAYSSVQDDLIYTVSDTAALADPVGFPNFKYIGDVYVDGAMVARVKKIPDPVTGIGIFNIAQIVRSYLQPVFDPQFGQVLAQVFADKQFFIDVVVKFGEEYAFASHLNLANDTPKRYFNNYNTKDLGMAGSGALNSAGIGLRGDYYNTEDPTGTIVFTRIDPTVNYTWTASPAPGINVDHFSIRWTGQILAEFGETYTFYTQNDDGVRLWVNGVLIIDDWNEHNIEEHSGTIALDAGVRYEIKLEFFEREGEAVINLLWQSPSVAKAIIPQAAMFPTPLAVSSLASFLDKVASRSPYSGKVLLTSPYFFVPYFPTSTAEITLTITPVGPGRTFTDTFMPASAYEMLLFNLSPSAINYLQFETITPATTGYSVQINDQVYFIDIVCEAIYQPFMVHFLNQLGGFDSKLFSKVSRRTYDITRTDYGKLPYTVDGNGAVKYRSDGGVYNESRAVYASQFKETLVLNSDFLTDAEYSWLRDLLVSPMIYVEDGGYLWPAVITDTQYESKKVANDDLTNLTLTIDFGKQLNAQYR